MIADIIKEIEKISGDYSGYEIFSDWVKATAIGITNGSDMIRGKVWKKREEQYKDLVRKHGAEKMKTFADMTGMLCIALEENMEDVLGRIYMEAGLGSKQTGQFFTPFHISHMIARIRMGEADEKEPVVLNEPSCGGGGMIIAAAKVLKEQGIDYQRIMKVTAQDLDWKGVYMTYVQLSLLGISATVIQGDTLAAGAVSKEQILYTPKKKGMLL